jgi:hypothetical protein
MVNLIVIILYCAGSKAGNLTSEETEMNFAGSFVHFVLTLSPRTYPGFFFQGGGVTKNLQNTHETLFSCIFVIVLLVGQNCKSDPGVPLLDIALLVSDSKIYDEILISFGHLLFTIFNRAHGCEM